MAVHSGLGITGYGLACSLGSHAPTACAAALSGIVRATPLDFDVFAEGLQEEVAVMGHSAHHLTRGFGGLGRLHQLATEALRDLASRTTVDPTPKTGFYVLLDDGYYSLAHQALQGAAQGLDPDDEQDLHEELAAFQESARNSLIPAVLDACGLSVEPSNQRVFFGGPATFAQLLRDASVAVSRGACDRAIVGGIGCLIDGPDLARLASLGLLKTGDNAAGLMPGEAASFLDLSSASDNRPIATLVSTASLRADRPFFGDAPPLGQGLAESLAAVLATRDGSAEWMLTNLNGTMYRSADLGQAMVRLTRDGISIVPDTETPLASIGDVGVAAGPAMATLAAHGLRRGLIKGPGLVALVSDDGGRSAFLMEPA